MKKSCFFRMAGRLVACLYLFASSPIIFSSDLDCSIKKLIASPETGKISSGTAKNKEKVLGKPVFLSKLLPPNFDPTP